MSFEIPTNKPPVEIERKFLVRNLPEGLAEYEHEEIRQGYLVIGADGSETRVRDRDGLYTLTVKSKGDRTRGEYEIEIGAEEFETLWPATEGRRVEKSRFSIPHEGATIELDIYYGELMGLVTAEVEFDSESDADGFEIPAWFSDEVTDNKSFKNQQLAENGFPL